MILWTRVTLDPPLPGEVTLGWSVARDPELSDVIQWGTLTTGPDRDWTAKVDVSGLEPATHYWFAFELDGERSPIARTKTLPDGHVERLRFAQCSCSKYNSGFFNAYARIADRDDLDFVLHLGDYIYEAAQNPPASQTPGADIGRPMHPLNECVTLEDYRRRYALYRSDPDAQRMHLRHAVIATVDDHEYADGAWRGGSVEHKPERDGPWEDRRQAAMRARWEWTPTRKPDPDDPIRVWHSVALGNLAEIFLIDTRSYRDEPARFEAAEDLARTQLGAAQRAWFLEALAGSAARWKVIGNGSMFTPIWVDGGFPDSVLPALIKLKLIHDDAKGFDPDQWEGYPAERFELVQAFGQTPGEIVILSGDIHAAMAAEVSAFPFKGSPRVAVEFVTTSITSPNLDDKMKWPRRTRSLPIEQELLGMWPHVRWVDFDSHGYIVVTVGREDVTAEWWAVEGVLERLPGEERTATFRVDHGRPRLVPVNEESVP